MIVMQIHSLLFPRGIQDNELDMQDNSTFESYKCKNGKPFVPLRITLFMRKGFKVINVQ